MVENDVIMAETENSAAKEVHKVFSAKHRSDVVTSFRGRVCTACDGTTRNKTPECRAKLMLGKTFWAMRSAPTTVWYAVGRNMLASQCWR